MTSRTRKVVHAGLIALFSSFVEVGMQLQAGNLNLTRAAIFGVIMGIVGRALGSGLAAIAMPDPPADTKE